MQEILDAILLGLLEGLTEFLPVSSTAHLLLVQALIGFDPPGRVFPVVIQFGAILSVVAVYRQKFWDAAVNLPSDPRARQFVLGVLVAFLPSAVGGALLHKFIKNVLFEPATAVIVIAVTTLLGGIIILVFERMAPKPRYRHGDHLPLRTCFEIGLCQVLAVIPGVSRSGATILGGQLLGVERKAAAEFTFFLAVPTMLGASAYDLYQNWSVLDFSGGLVIAVGFVMSFAIAYVVVKTFIAFVGRYGLAPFGWYRIGLGLILLGLVYL
ncbi:MAG: undecaprenyl-diphosphate phosphatase [Alphaproteobacteria bacterium]